MNRISFSVIFFLITLLFMSIGSITNTKALPLSQGVVSIVFDDNYDSQYDFAWASMQERGIRGTFYVRTATMGNSGFMTYNELQNLQTAGNEIASHSVTHRSFTDLSIAEIRSECINSKNTLESNGLSISNFAYPNGLTNNAIDEIVDDYYTSGRTAYISPYLISDPNAQFRLPGFSSEDEIDELQTLKNFIDQIYSSNSWGIILFHNIIPNDYSNPYTTTLADFENFLDYTLSLNIPILTVNQTLNTLIPLTITTNYGSVTPDSGLYLPEIPITIEAFAPVAGVGERFVWEGWSGSGVGSYSGMNNPTTITLDNPITQNAIWRHEYLLTVSSNYGGVVPSSGEYWYEVGSETNIEAFAPVAGVGERFVWEGWSGSGVGSYSGMNNPTTITLNQAITEVATWKAQYFVDVFSPYGIVTGTGWYDIGDHVYAEVEQSIIMESENIRYVFLEWIGDSSGFETTSDLITVTTPLSINASWEKQYLFTFNQEGLPTDHELFFTINSDNESIPFSVWIPEGNMVEFEYPDEIQSGKNQYVLDLSMNQSMLKATSPITITATYKLQQNMTIIIIITIVIILVFAIIFLKRKNFI